MQHPYVPGQKEKHACIWCAVTTVHISTARKLCQRLKQHKLRGDRQRSVPPFSEAAGPTLFRFPFHRRRKFRTGTCRHSPWRQATRGAWGACRHGIFDISFGGWSFLTLHFPQWSFLTKIPQCAICISCYTWREISTCDSLHHHKQAEISLPTRQLTRPRRPVIQKVPRQRPGGQQ